MIRKRCPPRAESVVQQRVCSLRRNFDRSVGAPLSALGAYSNHHAALGWSGALKQAVLGSGGSARHGAAQAVERSHLCGATHGV